MGKVVLALNGELYGRKIDYQSIIGSEETVFIAADGGALLFEELGFQADFIIGDLDSISEKKINEFREKGSRFIKYPVEKDETDGELALEFCRKNNLNNIIIIGSQGGRFDQQLANVLLLEFAYRSDINAVIKEPGLEIGLIGKEKRFFNYADSSLSLIPLTEKVDEVVITGCKYRLNGEDLLRFKTRGISNLFVENEALVSVRSGLLLYIIE